MAQQHYISTTPPKDQTDRNPSFVREPSIKTPVQQSDLVFGLGTVGTTPSHQDDNERPVPVSDNDYVISAMSQVPVDAVKKTDNDIEMTSSKRKGVEEAAGIGDTEELRRRGPYIKGMRFTMMVISYVSFHSISPFSFFSAKAREGKISNEEMMLNRERDSICVCLWMVNLEITIVSTSIVPITNDLGGFSKNSWVLEAYLLTYVGIYTFLHPVSISFTNVDRLPNNLVQIQRHLRPQTHPITGTVIFTTFSGACGAAQTMTQLYPSCFPSPFPLRTPTPKANPSRFFQDRLPSLPRHRRSRHLCPRRYNARRVRTKITSRLADRTRDGVLRISDDAGSDSGRCYQ